MSDLNVYDSTVSRHASSRYFMYCTLASMIPFNSTHGPHELRILNYIECIIQSLIRQQNRPIKLIRQTPMTTADHHRTDNQLAEDCKLANEGGTDCRATET
jgi:hypothetical protein